MYIKATALLILVVICSPNLHVKISWFSSLDPRKPNSSLQWKSFMFQNWKLHIRSGAQPGWCSLFLIFMWACMSSSFRVRESVSRFTPGLRAFEAEHSEYVTMLSCGGSQHMEKAEIIWNTSTISCSAFYIWLCSTLSFSPKWSSNWRVGKLASGCGLWIFWLDLMYHNVAEMNKA